jgi:hemoglobin/transferrin/lactoferrin receptor protein
VWGPAWSGELTAAWLQGEVETYERGTRPAAEPIDKLPPAHAMLAIRRSVGAASFVELVALAVDRADRLSTRDRADTQRIPPNGTPGYLLLDLRGELPLPRGARLVLEVENLLDVEYRVHGSGQNGPGRSLVGSLDLRF